MKPRLVICYKNFAYDNSVSHRGMGLTGAYTCKSIQKRLGIQADALPIHGADDLDIIIAESRKTDHPITHVVLSAQWIPTKYLALLARKYLDVKFAQNCHSNVGFLQAEPPAIKLLRQAIDLEQELPNFHASCNNQRLVTALQNMYGSPVTFLPNLYYLTGNEQINKPLWNGGTLRIGAFGSHRIYKNFSTAIAAGVELIVKLKVHGEIWINSGRHDGAGDVVYRALKAWTAELPNVELKQLHWASWTEFKKVVGSMNILMQPSYTETFNNVTADGISQGTPSVVSPAIEWAPKSWIAEPDFSSDVASTARRLLFDPYAAQDGYDALVKYVDQGVPYWETFLGLD